MTRFLIGSTALGWSLCASIASATSHPVALQAAIASATLAETPESGDTPEVTRFKALDLVKKARQAMDGGNLEAADVLLSRAEQLNPSFGIMYLGDTPKKARKDLERALSKQKPGAARPTANPPFGNRPADAGPTGQPDPFAAPDAVNAASQPTNDGAVPPEYRLPPTRKPDPFAPDESPKTTPAAAEVPAAGARLAPPGQLPAAAPGGSAAPTGDAGVRAKSDRLLLAARKALAVGDVRRATESLVQAKALQVKYEFHEDSPAKIETAIARYSDLMQRPAGEKGSEAYRRRYAELQMQQAEDLLRWSEFDEAERLVGEAQRLGVNYNPFETSPTTIKQRIAEARQKGGAHKIEHLPPVTDAAAAWPAGGTDPVSHKAKSLELVRQARAALAACDLARAESLALEAEQLRVPDSQFASTDDRAFLVLLQVQKARREVSAAANPSTGGGSTVATTTTPGGVVPATGVVPIDASGAPANPVTGAQAFYDPSRDPTRNMPATALQPATGSPDLTNPRGEALPPGSRPGQGFALFEQGEEAMRNRDFDKAMSLFREAYKYRDELDPATQQRLQDRLQFIAQPSTGSLPTAGETPLLTETANAQQVKYRQVSAEVARQENLAAKLRESDPKRAQAILEQLKATVESAQLDPAPRDVLLRRVTRDLQEMQAYMEANRGRLELNERNAAVRDEIERERKVKVEVQDKLAQLVDQFNKLMDEQRYAEAEVLAKQASELSPEEPVVLQIRKQAAFVRAHQNNLNITEEGREKFVALDQSIQRSAIPFDDSNPILFGDIKDWKLLTDRRRKYRDQGRKRSEREIEIEQRLKTPVLLSFREAPLNVVLDKLSKLAQVNLHVDPRGLADEGVTTDTPVTIDLSQEISLKSALALILEPLRLTYVVKNEVLTITSEQLRDGEVYPVTYNVADLVIPIPNFVPGGNMGLAGALENAQRNLGVGGTLGLSQSPLAVAATPSGGSTNAMIDPSVLGQFGGVPGGGGGFGGNNGPAATGMQQNIPFGPGGMGGGTQPDFDSLMDLITATIEPTTWSEVGGAGAMKPYPTNLSLVISQTQEVHEQIADLLDQLRRLQDLQVTIEVRFINLSDTFYERMGMQFDFNLNDYADTPYQIFGRADPTISTPFNAPPFGNVLAPNQSNAGDPNRNIQNRDLKRDQSLTVGMQAPGVFSNDLDIPFRQSSFGLTAPSNALFNYAGVGAAGGGTLGFAILSSLEAYFFMEAVQSDIRTNIMQAPKVTLFNGQQAFVSDTAQSPFVISVIPVVGDFAAAQQPVIVVLSQGTFLSVQAVVSNDRRFVRLTVVPFFSQIGKVNEFTFTGSSSTRRTSSSDGPTDVTTSRSNDEQVTREGTTVQLPTFAFTTVTTTVSVPDGGTVLLGGIKRLSEQRNENGVPILNKIPYVNRLFNNIGTGRATSSLMMMVTPRIIIQDEEEALLGVQQGP